MAHRTVKILSNAGTVADVLIPDLGIRIPAGGGFFETTDHIWHEKIAGSHDLPGLLTDQAFGVGEFDSTLIMNDGTNNIPADDTEDWLGDQPDVFAIVYDYDFSEAPNKDFGTLVAGDDIIDAEVEVKVAFDDPATVLTLGLVSAPGNILTAGQIDPESVGVYHTGENQTVAGSDQVRLVITPGASTQGSGRVTVLARR